MSTILVFLLTLLPVIFVALTGLILVPVAFLALYFPLVFRLGIKGGALFRVPPFA